MSVTDGTAAGPPLETAPRTTPVRGGRVELVSLRKSYGTQLVLKGIDLTIESGEFFSLLGPSGCGKTTTLRLIGGFEQNEAGAVLIDGVNIAGVAPERRPVNTVFQNYALFPHMSVADNVGFGLRFQDCTKDERRRRIGEALELVRLSEYAARRPHQLSGGQQQRVALARALVLRPRVLLLDEPLGALDAKLRRALQLELKELHREVGITFVYVTHDQEEALTMSDRLAVMREGTIEQVGPPQEVYDAPDTTYVADFLGLANLLPGVVSSDGEVEVLGRTMPAATSDVRGPCTVFARPERLGLTDTDANVTGVVLDVVFVGSTTHVRVAVADQDIEVVLSNDGASWVPTPGSRVGVVLPAEALRVLER